MPYCLPMESNAVVRKNFYHIKRLKSELEKRQRLNERYSLRAFAQFLEIDASVLSAVLKGKRPLPAKHVEKIKLKLNFTPKEEKNFLASLSRWSTRSNKTFGSVNEYEFIEDSERNFRILSEWEYFALLSLMDVKDFRQDFNWISEKMNISKSRAQSIVEELFESGLLFINETKNWQRSSDHLATSDGVLSRALRLSHKESLNIALEKIDSVPLAERSFSSITLPANPEMIPRAKELIKTFRRQMSDVMKEEECQEVYQLSVQFIPLTGSRKKRIQK